jgi:replicative DNA helicase
MIDLEHQVLGVCLLDGKGYWRIADRLVPDDFADPDCRELYEVMGDLGRKGIELDAITVGEHCPRLAVLAVTLANECTTTANLIQHADLLIARAEQRRFRATRERIAKCNSPAEAFELLSACQPRNAQAVKPAKEFLRETMARMHARSTLDAKTVGLPSGIEDLDKMTCGFQPGDLIVLAARPSVGKTALALQFAAHASQDLATPTLFFSVEQSGSSLTDRLLSHTGRIPLSAVIDPRTMEDHHWPRSTQATAKISESKLHIDETGDLSLDMVAARSRQIDAQFRLGLIVIDYLQLMRMPKADRPDLSIGAVTRGLKVLAKTLNVPLILLSQLNREGVGRPTLKDLRGSGDIEQDADLIMFLYRRNDQFREHTTLVVEKQRNGPTGEVELHSNLSLMRFDRWDGEVPRDEPVQRGFRANSR